MASSTNASMSSSPSTTAPILLSLLLPIPLSLPLTTVDEPEEEESPVPSWLGVLASNVNSNPIGDRKQEFLPDLVTVFEHDSHGRWNVIYRAAIRSPGNIWGDFMFNNPTTVNVYPSTYRPGFLSSYKSNSVRLEYPGS
ncbi:hypothetical protein C8J56DRAFT_1054415 [Mycena floridula]|nr:hypothetical protein C8J56DRAFT_1054415 [Mycena floridula]